MEFHCREAAWTPSFDSIRGSWLMTSALSSRTLASRALCPCGQISRIPGGLGFGGAPCRLTHAGWCRPAHRGESMRGFPSPCLACDAPWRVPWSAGGAVGGYCPYFDRAAGATGRACRPGHRVLFGLSAACVSLMTCDDGLRVTSRALPMGSCAERSLLVRRGGDRPFGPLLTA
jgi:hypothetical protein